MKTSPGNSTGGSDLNQRVEELLNQLSTHEKVSLLSGRDLWHTMPVDRLGIPALTMTDGPSGVRATNPEFGRLSGPTTCFPTGISMGATWNPDLIGQAAQAMAEETLAMGCDILLGPCVNIIRNPVGGRNFETYGEDPYLAGQMAIAWINGVQSRGVGASLKHFACNNQEVERFRVSSEVDERTLREIYLPAFEEAVKTSRPWTVMCSYNRINGIHASQNDYLINQILRKEWNFEGPVISDWGANHTTVESIQAGLDLEMPGPAKYYGKLLEEAIYHWQVDESVIDSAVRRLLRTILHTGKMDSRLTRKPGGVNTPAHQALARRVAEEAITLLKNENDTLPIDPDRVKKLAVIGPNAAEARLGGGGSSYVQPPYRISPLEGLQELAGSSMEIEYAQGCDNYVKTPVVQHEWLSLPDESGPGMQAEYYSNTDLSGNPTLKRVEPAPDFWWFSSSPAENIPVDHFSAIWMARLTVPESGRYFFPLSNSGVTRIYLDGSLLIELVAANNQKFENSSNSETVYYELEAGRIYHFRIEFAKYAGQEFANVRLGLFRSLPQNEDPRIDQAVALARSSDMVLIFAGNPESYETEGEDRTNIELPGRQNELVKAVAAVNPNTVVILNVGGPVTMPWVGEVAAILEAYYPGMEGGRAIANILSGAVNPSGKLTMTFPKKLERLFKN